MKLYSATIQLLVQAESEAAACDAVAETLRPQLQEFGGECFVDWRYRLEPKELVLLPDWAEYKPREEA